MNSIVLDWLWRSSWQAAVLAAVVLALRMTLRGTLRPDWRLALWTLVLLRLALPVLPASRVSLFRAADWVRSMIGTSRVERATTTEDGIAVRPVTTTSEVHYGGIELSPPEATPAGKVITPVITVSRAIVVAWLGVATLLMARLLIANGRFARRLHRGSRPADERVTRMLDRCRRDMRMSRAPRLLVTDAVDAPAVSGLFRPTVLLPASLADHLGGRQLRLVLMHELAHVKCRDIAVDWLWAMAVVAHWFNPLVWIARSRFRADRELARDAMVLSVAGADSAEGYGRTILQLVQRARPLRLCPGLVGMADSRGKAELRRRIHMISSYPHEGRSRFTVLGLCLFVLVGCAALTDSRAADEPATTTTPPRPPTPAPARQAPVATEQRVPYQEQPKPVDPQDAQAMAKLDRVLPELNFAAVPFSDVIDFLRDITNSNIFVNWKALEAAGIDRSTAVTARLRDVKASKALKVILTDVGGGVVKLDYTVDEGVVTISTRDDLSRNVMTRVYDVRDLLITVPDYVPEEESRDPVTPATTQPAPTGRDATVRQLINLIEETVATETWRDKGGVIASIKELSGQLIVTQTPENMQQIERLLEQLRQSRGLQITVETRFLWFEDAMIEKLSPALQKAIKSTQDMTTANGASGTGSLSDEQVKELLGAVQKSAESTTVTAPRLTLFNGQRASVKIATNRPYVASVQARTGADGKVTYEPQMKQIETGLILDTRATASSDRKYVTLTLHPLLQRLTDVKTEPASGVPPEANVTVEHPVYVTRELRMTVSVPDGGTALIGGFPMDQQVESRERTNRALTDPAVAPLLQPAKGYHLYMLARPTLIVQREVEQEQFPLINEHMTTHPSR